MNPCFFVQETPLKIDVVYVHPISADKKWRNNAIRFVESYVKNPPGIEHNMVVVCNGKDAGEEESRLFSPIKNVSFMTHDNTGYDIGAYQKASRASQADMIVFFGSSSYVQGNGWLYRMAEVFKKDPKIQYGSMGNRGDLKINIYPHIRTTGFWMQPALFNAYPHMVKRPEDRFPFEHGPNCFTEWLKHFQIPSIVVTWLGEYTWEHWDDDPNAFNRGDQSSLLSGDRICLPPVWPRKK